MLKEERLQAITEMLQTHGYAEVSQLCRLFGVTEMTIRRDLNDLVERKVAVRSHGGAMMRPEALPKEVPYEIRILDNPKKKQAIARKALEFVSDGERIFFDSSTSAFCLARILSNDHNFLAVTNMVNTAKELNSRSNIRVIFIGGELQKTTEACMGMFADEMIEQMHFDTAFIGVSNISEDGVITTKSMDECQRKRQILRRSDKVVLLADSTKIGGKEFLFTANLQDFYAMITDNEVPTEFVQFCKEKGIRLIVAE